jgi:hypothetical protein
MALSSARGKRYAALRMTSAQKIAFEAIVSFVHRAAMTVAELPKEQRATALQNALRSIEAELRTKNPS